MSDLHIRIMEAVQDGEDAFWAKIAEHFPEVKTGDIDPLVAGELYNKLLATVIHWYEINRKEEP